VIVARGGQIPSVVQDGTTGLLGDAACLANALRRLRADAREAARIGELARQEVVAGHAWPLRFESILEIVRRAVCVREQVIVE